MSAGNWDLKTLGFDLVTGIATTGLVGILKNTDGPVRNVTS